MTTPNELACRTFNSIDVDTATGLLRKESTARQRLSDEYEWYKALPPELRDLTPEVVGWADDGTTAALTQRYIEAPNLATPYVSDTYSPSQWQRILMHVFEVHERFRKHPKKVSREDVNAIYVDKTLSRLSLMGRSSERWRTRLGRSVLFSHGTRLRGVRDLRPKITLRSQSLAANVSGTAMHGDFCLSNILYDDRSEHAWLVDPRGRFGARGIHGDPRYDIAKLRHSIVSGYDFMTTERYWLACDGDELDGSCQWNDTATQVRSGFDTMISERGYDLEEIMFIEGLLFLSMTPLHTESPRRQTIMFLTGLRLLNEVLG